MDDQSGSGAKMEITRVQEIVPNRTKLLASRRAKRCDDLISFINAEFSAMSRWIMAALLTVNGASIAATLKVVEARPVSYWVFGLFVGGVMLAIANGWLAQAAYSNTELQKAIIDYADHLSWVAESGEADEETEKGLKDKIKHEERRHWIAPTAGWLSAICFIAGMAGLWLHA